jgi:hypothetical protein
VAPARGAATRKPRWTFEHEAQRGGTVIYFSRLEPEIAVGCCPPLPSFIFQVLNTRHSAPRPSFIFRDWDPAVIYFSGFEHEAQRAATLIYFSRLEPEIAVGCLAGAAGHDAPNELASSRLLDVRGAYPGHRRDEVNPRAISADRAAKPRGLCYTTAAIDGCRTRHRRFLFRAAGPQPTADLFFELHRVAGPSAANWLKKELRAQDKKAQ